MDAHLRNIISIETQYISLIFSASLQNNIWSSLANGMKRGAESHHEIDQCTKLSNEESKYVAHTHFHYMAHIDTYMQYVYSYLHHITILLVESPIHDSKREKRHRNVIPDFNTLFKRLQFCVKNYIK